MKEVYFNGHNVPPTWRNRGVEMKVDGKYIPLPGETHLMVSDEDFEFCERVAHKYNLNLNEFCALVDYAKGEIWKLKEEKAYQPISDALAAGERIDRLVIETKDDKNAIHKFVLRDPYLEAYIIQRYKGWRSFKQQFPNPDGSLFTVHSGNGIIKYEHTLRVILANLHSYLDNQKKGPSQRRIIIGLICQYLSLYVKKPLLSEAEWKAAEKRGDKGTAAATWEKYLESNIKSWIKDFDW